MNELNSKAAEAAETWVTDGNTNERTNEWTDERTDMLISRKHLNKSCYCVIMTDYSKLVQIMADYSKMAQTISRYTT